MRPKLDAHTTYSLIPDGIYLRNNRTSLNLRGKNLDHFLELLPSLNGDYTLEEITQGSSANKKKLVTKFLQILLRSGFLKDTSQNQPHTLTQAELTTYSANIAFIDSFQTAATSHFASLRNKQLLIIGSGLSFTALVQACLRGGIKQINIIRTPECDTVTDSLSDLTNQFAPNDPAQKVQSIAPPQWDNQSNVLNTIHTYDALLHITDRPMLARAQMLNRLCIAQKKTFIQAIIVDDHAWVGPLVSAERGGCWECAWRHLQSNQVASPENLPTPFHDHTTLPINQFCTSLTTTITANRLIFELFKHFTQAGRTERAASLIDIHLSQHSLISKRHTFLPHSHCRTCQQPTAPTAAQFLNQIQQLQQQAPLDPATFCENIAQNVDPQLGLFTTLDTDDFAQAPLAVYKVGLSNPQPLQPPRKPIEVIGVGIDGNKARIHACQRACERYAASFVDPRRLLRGDTIQQQTAPVIPVDQLILQYPLADRRNEENSTSLPKLPDRDDSNGTMPNMSRGFAMGTPSLPRNVEEWTWALDLYTQQACLIPAPLAFPSLLHEEFRAEDERGIGSGMSWAEAICQALFNWGTFLALEQARDEQQQYPQVDLTMIPMTPEGAHLHYLLQIVGEQITVYDVASTLQVPTLAICVGKNVVAYSTHCDVAQALSAGLRQAMQRYQSRQAQQPEYAVVPVPDLPELVQTGRKVRTDAHTRSDGASADRGFSFGYKPLEAQRNPCPYEIPTPERPLHLPTDDKPRWSAPYQTPPEAWPARQEWLLQMLQTHHFHAWVLPLDHDPVLTQILPYVVRVVLARI